MRPLWGAVAHPFNGATSKPGALGPDSLETFSNRLLFKADQPQLPRSDRYSGGSIGEVLRERVYFRLASVGSCVWKVRNRLYNHAFRRVEYPAVAELDARTQTFGRFAAAETVIFGDGNAVLQPLAPHSFQNVVGA